MKEKNHCSRSELRAPIQSSNEPDRDVPSIIPCDPFIWPDRLGENTSLCLNHVATTLYYRPCTAHSIERISVAGWSSSFAAGRNQAPLLHRPSPSLNGNESVALDATPADLKNTFQLVNTRQDYYLYLPLNSWMNHLQKGKQEAVQTMRNDFEILSFHAIVLMNKRLKVQYRPCGMLDMN